MVTQLYQEAATVSPNVNVRLHTHTPVKELSRESNQWSLRTSRGDVSCKYVIHATNAYASHLLPFLAGIESTQRLDSLPRGAYGILPTRGQIGSVRASVPPNELGWLSSWDDNDGDEYWFPRYQDTTQKNGTSTGKNPLIILGGGRHKASEDTKETGISDDSTINPVVSRALRSYLPELFPAKFSAPASHLSVSRNTDKADRDNWEMEWVRLSLFVFEH